MTDTKSLVAKAQRKFKRGTKPSERQGAATALYNHIPEKGDIAEDALILAVLESGFEAPTSTVFQKNPESFLKGYILSNQKRGHLVQTAGPTRAAKAKVKAKAATPQGEAATPKKAAKAKTVIHKAAAPKVAAPSIKAVK